MLKLNKKILLALAISICPLTVSFADSPDFVYIDSTEKVANLNSAITVVGDTEKLVAEKERLAAEKKAEEERLKKETEAKSQYSTQVNTSSELSQEDNNIFNYIMRTNPALSTDQALRIINAVNKNTADYGINKYIVYAIMEQESRFNPNAVGNGAYGLMQLYYSAMPYMGITVDRALIIEDNIRAGVSALSTGYKMFGDEIRALSSYNWGSGNVSKGNYNTKYANSILTRKTKIANAVK
ncbi:lytic transglycosylase domain-containing protein [Criibacterium bergeronii]|uniref:Lytic transglycosylase domain-containing protein n=1 Tax=Criibacterium bergeronii TaxID=1871336 RepID=A0A1C0AEP3_9FIRM|nr:lytic transglycosylase domain-containing protein [Criibacterium bergeronii]MBS6063954.1 transglycosylase SLT domain-containing protein [Peptostreptococcaceae bacterium]RDY22046.1 lytic transglycosylase domain-containing protein [Criibacterium bergeronii]